MEDESVLNIDRDRLDEEWERQPALIYEWCEHLAETRLALETAKSDYDVVKAKQEKSIRADPESFGIAKLTEAAVTAALTINAKVQAADAAVRGAKHAVDIANAMVTALEHKKRALESLVQLHGMGYFAEPRATDTEVVETQRKKRTRQAGR